MYGTRKVFAWLCSGCLVYVLMSYQLSNRRGNLSSVTNTRPVQYNTQQRLTDTIIGNKQRYTMLNGRKSYVSKALGSKSGDSNQDEIMIYSHLKEVINEKDAFQYKPCDDANLAADPRFSKITLKETRNQLTYEIGNKIYVKATLYDSYGRPKTAGGDLLRARIRNDALKAYAPGVVYDHWNGSYTIILEALWSGKSYISVTIAHTREAITAQNRLKSSLVSLRLNLARYENETMGEDVVCHPDKKHLIARTDYKDVCNFTNLNSGMPWYCGKPHNPSLKCTDWKFVRIVPQKTRKAMSLCEIEIMSSRYHMVLNKTIEVTVNVPTKRRKAVEHYQPQNSCVEYNTTKLWYQKETTGFFYNGTWTLKHCRGFHRANFLTSLRNKRLYLIGDSTTRQWYQHILKRFNCTQYTEPWTHEKWEKPSACTVARNNFTAIWATHSQPFYTGPINKDPKYTLVSVPKQLGLIESDEEAIVLIHIFLHMVPYHNRYFRDKMKAVRVGVERLIKRNRKVKIFIKMPHTFTVVYGNGAINDFPGNVFSRIIVDTFKGLYDKVVVLDNKDATNAVASELDHPSSYIVTSMVDQLFSYICE